MAWWGFGLAERVWCDLLVCIHLYISGKPCCSALTVSFFDWTLAKFFLSRVFRIPFLVANAHTNTNASMRLCANIDRARFFSYSYMS